MTFFPAAALLAFASLVFACRNPQDPSRTQPAILPDGGPSPSPTPEIQPDTGKPIGPVAGEAPSQIPPPQGGAGGRGPGSGGNATGAVPGNQSEKVSMLVPPSSRRVEE